MAGQYLAPAIKSNYPPCELFRSPRADLFLLVGDEKLLMKSGDFSLLLVKSSLSPLAAVMAMVGEVQWPLGSDCEVCKEGHGGFIFSLPGHFNYLLFLGTETCTSSADLRRLEDLLKEYAVFAAPQQRSGNASGTWQGDKSRVLEGASASGSGEVSMETQVPGMGIGVALLNKRPGYADSRGRVQRARRLSAIAKLFSKTLERGAINVSTHVEPMFSRAVPFHDLHPTAMAGGLAMAGANAVIRVVDAVETGGRYLLESVGSAALEKCNPSSHEAGAEVDKASLLSFGWTLNKLGLMMLLRMIRASVAVHSSGSGSSNSSWSRSSSSSDIPRLLLSSSSSSSLSSKSPSAASEPSPGRVDMPGLPPSLEVMVASPPPLSQFLTLPAPCGQHPSTIPPPSVRRPLVPATSLSQDSSTPSFHVYKPQASPATAAPSSTPCPPPPLPRPPRFQPPPRS